MKENRKGSHTKSRLTAHLVWVTKYRYHVLQGDIKLRRSWLAGSDLRFGRCANPKRRSLKRPRSYAHRVSAEDCAFGFSETPERAALSRLIQQEFPHLQKRYWGRHFWATGYGAWSTGNITEEAVQEYLEHHRQPSNKETNPFILEDD